MKTRFLILLVILVVLILVFIWGTTNFLRCSTDTPGDYHYVTCPQIDVYALPALITALAMIGIVPVLTWMSIKRFRLRIVFTALYGIGIFFTFIGITILILVIRN